jgi:hypothetical protein
MELGIKYQGRQATISEVEQVQGLIDNHPEYSRRRLSQELCKLWNWTYSSGYLKDQVCRGYLLALARAGLVQLPPKRCSPPNPLAKRKKPEAINIGQSAVLCPLSELSPIIIRQVLETEQEKLYNGLVSQYHYLGYVHPVGEHLKYLIYSKGQVISCISFSSAPRHISSRDNYIGWNQTIRKHNIHLIAYNTRFLILPWVRVKNLASHVLGSITKQVSGDWEKIYGHPIYFLETFVDTERFAGTCYKAANWTYLGKTTGRGKNDQTNKPNRSIKAVWGYVLDKDFRRKLNV